MSLQRMTSLIGSGGSAYDDYLVIGRIVAPRPGGLWLGIAAVAAFAFLWRFLALAEQWLRDQAFGLVRSFLACAHDVSLSSPVSDSGIIGFVQKMSSRLALSACAQPATAQLQADIGQPDPGIAFGLAFDLLVYALCSHQQAAPAGGVVPLQCLGDQRASFVPDRR